MKKLILSTLAVIAMTVSANAAQYYYFNRYTTTEGLPNNSVTCSAQDKYGFMWFGTKDGICRFDGHDFLLIGGKGPDEILNGMALDLEVDVDGILWFSNTNGIGSYNPATDEVTSLGKVGNTVAFDIEPDLTGNVWIISDDIYRYNKYEKQIHSYNVHELAPSYAVADKEGNVWVTAGIGGIYKYDTKRDKFEHYPVIVEGVTTDIVFKHISLTANGNLILSTFNEDVVLVDTGSFSGRRIFRHEYFWERTEIWDVTERVPGEIWCGTDQGIFIFDALTEGNKYSFTKNEPNDNNSLSSNSVRNLTVDSEGNVWVGTFFNGVNLWVNKKDAFAIFYENPSENSIRGQIIRSIISDEDGILWIGTEDSVLNRYDPVKKTMEHYASTAGINIQSILSEGNRLWLCTYNKGVVLFDKEKRSIIKTYKLTYNSATSIVQLDNGSIIVGTSGGLYIYDKVSDSFVPFGPRATFFIHCMYEDKAGNLWVGTYGSGILILDKNGELIQSVSREDIETGLSSNYITSFYLDSETRMWVTTEGGGICYTDKNYNVKHLTFNKLSRGNGLSSNITCAATEDREGNIWISTSKGIMLIDLANLGIERLYTENSNIAGNQFSYDACCRTANGNLYFGTTNGMMSFSPTKMRASIVSTKLQITDIIAKSGTNTIHLKEEGKSCIESNRVVVKYKDVSSLKFCFSHPIYSSLTPFQYICTLRKGNSETVSVANGNSIEYTSITPGKMEFEVHLFNDSSEDCTKRVSIVVKPPFYLSAVAIAFYCLLGIIFISILIGVSMWQLALRRNHQIEQLEHDKEKEIYDAKINFFTNITHEIRTPLTLIKMPLDKLIANKEYTPAAEKDMLTMKDNTDRLLDLTNQLLDLKRIEQEEMRLSFTKDDICKITRRTCQYFEQISHDQHINLSLDIPDETIEIMCARDAVQKIISNLMSNAVKYGKDEMRVSVKLNEDKKNVVVRVDSNGDRIEAGDRERIFEKFYHGGKGTGLGLAFARTLAEMHNGKLFVDPYVTDMNSFVLALPVDQPDQVGFKQTEEKKEAKVVADQDDKLQHLLLVEDSVEFRDYLANELSAEYKVSIASNGKDAIEILEQGKIDLVVSDIMMPVMDGCQLCDFIKTTPEYSHIPVILMTAVIGMDTRIETLQVAADTYIEKPFPIELLRASIASLFKNREIAYKQFTSSPLSHFSNVKTSKIDDEYMTKLHDTVMKHLEEQDLGIETLTAILGTSKSTLYRKVKANTGLNINEYIRLCRLKQAAELLASQKYRVNEVAYLVGFSSPSYFATCFQNQFNQSPSSFVKSLKDE